MGETKGSGGTTRIVRFLRRLPGAGRSTPDRLARVGAVLVLGCLLLGLVSLVGGITRTDALTDARDRAARLAYDAAVIYSSLAQADADATSGYLAGGVDPPQVRQHYDGAVTRATQALADASRLASGDAGGPQVALIAAELPDYTGAVETARAYNRQQLPLGRTYLSEGSQLMRRSILPAAKDLRGVGVLALTADADDGAGVPFAVVLLGLGVLGGVVDLSLREARRTHKVISPGLVAAGALVIAGLLWWGIAGAVSGAAVSGASRHAAALGALDDAQAASLRARGAEGLALVARNGTSDQDVVARLDDLLGPVGTRDTGLLAAAASSGADVGTVRTDGQAWRDAHQAVRDDDLVGDYTAATASVTRGDSQARFTRLEDSLDGAVRQERDAFTADLATAVGSQAGLAEGSAVLFVLAGVAAGLAVGQRVWEYYR